MDSGGLLGTRLVEHRAHLRAQRGGVAIVVNHMMREGALSVKWPLGGLPTVELGGVPAAGGPDPGKPGFLAGIDENHPVAALVEASFEEEGCVDDEGPGPGRCSGEERLTMAGDPRVDQGFQTRALCRVLKDDRGDGAPVDWRRHAVGLRVAGTTVAHAVAPPSDELAADLGIVVGVTGEFIAVGDEAAFVGKGARDGGFAGADAAGEAKDGEGSRGREHQIIVLQRTRGKFRRLGGTRTPTAADDRRSQA